MSKKIKSLKDIEADFKKQSKGKIVTRKRSKGKIIADAIFYMALVAMIVVALAFSRGNTDSLKLGGYRLFEILTSSMKSVYPRGSIILVKETPPKELIVGDDITFISSDNNVITHRIIEIKENHDSTEQSGFVTKGVENDMADEEIVIAGNIIGKVVKSFPKIGAVLGFIRENILLVTVFCIALLGLSFSLKIFWRARNEK